jgi:hypothetical protein
MKLERIVNVRISSDDLARLDRGAKRFSSRGAYIRSLIIKRDKNARLEARLRGVIRAIDAAADMLGEHARDELATARGLLRDVVSELVR